MGTRFLLPVVGSRSSPTVQAVREKLGGRSESLPGVGELVRVPGADGQLQAGVVLFVAEDRFDVWVGKGYVRRVLRATAEPLLGDPPRELLVVASDAQVFAELQEGQRVRYSSHPSQLFEGTLTEKCRFGGLVRREDGNLVGVGFQRMWPVSDASAN